jgi:hypothetical protein
MIDTRFLMNPIQLDVDFNNLTAAIYAIEDINESLSENLHNKVVNGDYPNETIHSCLDNVMQFLLSLQNQMKGSINEKI